MKSVKIKSSWIAIVILVVLVSVLYVFLEWLFIVTKPSFMTILPISKKLLIFLYTSSLLSLITTAPIIVLFLIDKISKEKISGVLKAIGLFVPSVVLASLSLLLIDNFTYTIFRFGIVTSKGFVRGIYAFFYLSLLFIFFYQLVKLVENFGKKLGSLDLRKKIFINSLLVILIIPSIILPSTQSYFSSNDNLLEIKENAIERPHIILITPDGVNASHMSVYGYQRETTPFLEELSENALIAENGFTNSANTVGSITSILTSKFPTDVGVIYPPDILRGEDAYEHLPGVLKSLGYYTVQFGQDHFVDAYQLNILNGFDEANGRTEGKDQFLIQIKKYLPTNFSFFIYEAGNRIIDRLSHVFFIREMENTYAQVTTSPETIEDFEKIEKTIDLINKTDQPLFVHIHWMGTHGARFFPSEQVFSKGKNPENQLDWDNDFYDDSILEFDSAVSYLYSALEEKKLEEKIILFIGSDHGQLYRTNLRIPLIIKFPYGDYKGRISENVQNIDVAPTILDYININQPDWMIGNSLIDENYEALPIISLDVVYKLKNGSIDYASIEPPFYQFGYIHTIICDDYYTIDLSKYSWGKIKIDRIGDNCSTSKMDDLDVISLMINHLDTYGFDTSALQESIFGDGN